MKSFTLTPSRMEIGFRPARGSVLPADFGDANCMTLSRDGGGHAIILEMDEESITYVREISEVANINIVTPNARLSLQAFIESEPHDGEAFFRQYLQGNDASHDVSLSMFG